MNSLPKVLLATVAASSFLLSAQAQGPPPTVTFFVASDSHFGARRMSELNRAIVEQMNALPGTEYPPRWAAASRRRGAFSSPAT